VGGAGDHCPNSLYKTNFSPVLDERVVEKTGVQGAINARSGGAIQVLASRKRGWPLRLSRRSPLPTDDGRTITRCGTRKGIGLSDPGDLGLAPPGYDLPPLCGLREGL
jgi:hypothetical protein